MLSGKKIDNNTNNEEVIDDGDNMEKIGHSLASAISSDRNRIGQSSSN